MLPSHSTAAPPQGAAQDFPPFAAIRAAFIRRAKERPATPPEGPTKAPDTDHRPSPFAVPWRTRA